MAKKKNANAKRLKISKTQQELIVIVLITSLVVGVCLVLSIFFVKYIIFNTKVITAKDESIAEYEKTISNVGICKDENGDGKYSDRELRDCDPDAISSVDMPGTLRYNVMVNMAKNTDLETVARQGQEDCYGENGKKIDYHERYEQADTDDQREFYLDMIKMCSALRVIPDALPAQENIEALMASLNQIYIMSDWEPLSLQPNGTATESNIPGLGTIPIMFSVEGESPIVLNVLSNIEKSIRAFDIKTASISWLSSNELSLEAQALSYYTNAVTATESYETVYASDEARDKAGGGV